MYLHRSPYNTGSEGWAYNDNVKSPEIRKWLGQVVGPEGETLDRHDRWLCMMYPRLLLLKRFLSNDGAIFISIDDNESPNLRYLMDEIFGASNFLCAFAWEKRYAPPPDTKDIGYLHETVMAYRASPSFQRNLLALTADQTGRYKNPDNDLRGPWKPMDYTCRYTADERPNLYYPIQQPNIGKKIWPKRTRVWAMSKETHLLNVEEKRIWWGIRGTNKVPALKNFLTDIQQGMMPVSLLKYEVVGHTDEAAKELRPLLPNVKFTPKPTRLIQHLLRIATDRDSLILDSFAGSGTTGHAVCKQNKEDKGMRRFILVQMPFESEAQELADENLARDLTAKRVRRVSKGYTNGKGKKIKGLGKGFQYYRLSDEPLFEAGGPIRADVTFRQLAEFVWFMETGTGLDKSSLKKGRAPSAFLGSYKDRAVFLLYNGILKDKSDIGGNVLNGRTLELLNSLSADFVGERVIYGARTRFDQSKLAKLGITFHQLPYDLAKKTWF